LIDYDLLRLLEHPLRFREFTPSVIATFGGQAEGRIIIQLQWKPTSGADERQEELAIVWDVHALSPMLPHVEEDVAILLERDEDRARRTELAAVVVAVAVMAHVEPATRFTRRSSTGTSHDYYLNETRDEMIEVAGRWEGGLPGLFEEKRQQSQQNPTLRKRWVSVTVFSQTHRNRTEGLHP
jgi:hypothetical protein